VNKGWIILAAIAALCLTETVRAADDDAAVRDDFIKTVKDKKIDGKIRQISPTEITIEQLIGTEKIPVNEVESITFGGDSATLRGVRSDLHREQYEEALKLLDKIKPGSVQRPESLQDIEYYRALCEARVALAGNGSIVEAGSKMTAFVTANPESYHYFQACEILGDLLIAIGKHSLARKYYERVNQAPWPDYKMRASVAMGGAYLAEHKPAEALKFFEWVMAQPVDSDSALGQSQHITAILGKARCLAEANQADMAIKAVQSLIAKANPDDTAFLAAAYNALGFAYQKAGLAADARYAYLHVDTQYWTNAEAHAEALYYLSQLFAAAGKRDRAKECKMALEQQYKDSRWNRAEETK
jgi:tetratricopeptide (TPR) repeat protein